MKNIIMAVILVMMAVAPVSALTVTYNWTAPTTGSPVEHYEFQQNTDGDGWVDVGVSAEESITLDMPMGVTINRVRGVDEHGRAGPWSEPSAEFIDMGAPGGCSIPWIR